MSGRASAGPQLPGFDFPGIGLRAAVILALAALSVLAVLAAPFVYVAPNRLVVGVPYYAAAATGALAWPIIGCAALGSGLLAFDRGRGGVAAAATVFLSVAILLLAVALGRSAELWTTGQPAATRVRLASGAWTAFVILGAAVALAGARIGSRPVRWAVAVGLPLAVAALAATGWFGSLSLAVEYRARRDALHAAILEHLLLCASAVALAAVVAVALYAWRRARSIADLAINGVQVVPAVALFGGLVAAASALLTAFPSLREFGFNALGPGPAMIGIAGYLLLPFWRGIDAGLNAPDPATLDAATALGLTPRQSLLHVRLPLGAPILIGALRVAAVQSIGLATLGALVGAGGLGSIVFDGMAQFAPDLILLGAIPVIALSLAVDRVLDLVERRARVRWHA